jgi:hypothetical protein
VSHEVAKRPAFEPASELMRPAPADPRMRRPIATTMGALLVVLRVIAGVVWLVVLAAQWDDLVQEELDGTTLDPGEVDAARGIILVVGGIILAFHLVLALLVYLGFNWPRILVMVFSTLSISGTFAAWWAGEQEIPLDETMITLALDILVMLALSSHAARAYARRNDPRASPQE